MAKPQQPEIARSGPTDVVPEDNLPGHHPDHEQDKPSGDAFVQKLRDHAREVEESAEVEESTEPTSSEGDHESSELADKAAAIATAPLRVAAKAIETVRDALPGD